MRLLREGFKDSAGDGRQPRRPVMCREQVHARYIRLLTWTFRCAPIAWIGQMGEAGLVQHRCGACAVPESS